MAKADAVNKNVAESEEDEEQLAENTSSTAVYGTTHSKRVLVTSFRKSRLVNRVP